MGEMDQGIKRLIQLAPADFLRAALPESRFVRLLDTSVAMERPLIPDTLMLVERQAVECVVNLEAQAEGDPAIAQRLARYANRVTAIYDLPVISIVLWLQPKGIRPASPYTEYVGDLLVATRHFISVEIFNLDARDVIARRVLGLLPLVPFMRGADQDVDQAAMGMIKEAAPPEIKISMATLLAVFIARQFDQDIAKNILGRFAMNTSLLEESPLYREWMRQAKELAEVAGREQGLREGREKGLEEGREQGLEEGREQGLEEGREQGAREERVEMTRRVLELRHGALDAEFVAALQGATPAALDDIVAHLLTDSLADARGRLGLGTPPAAS